MLHELDRPLEHPSQMLGKRGRVTNKRGNRGAGCGSRQNEHGDINYIERVICGEIGANVKVLDNKRSAP
jgi:hypothetical protein